MSYEDFRTAFVSYLPFSSVRSDLLSFRIRIAHNEEQIHVQRPQASPENWTTAFGTEWGPELREPATKGICDSTSSSVGLFVGSDILGRRDLIRCRRRSLITYSSVMVKLEGRACRNLDSLGVARIRLLSG